MEYFYIRISTQEERGKQRYDRQERALSRYADAHGLQYDSHTIYRDDKSGKNFADRPEWQKLEKILRKGDTVVFKDVSRFTRAAEAGYEKYMDLMAAGINLIFLDNSSLSTENMRHLLDIADAESRAKKTFLMKTFDELCAFMVKILLVSELDRVEQERLILSQRIKDGISAAKEKAGKETISGRKKGTMEKLTPDLESDLMLYIDGGMTQIEILKKHNISRNTIKKYARLLRERMEEGH